MTIDSYRDYLRRFSKTTEINRRKTKVVNSAEFCKHRNLDFGHVKYCDECNKIYWKWLLRMREGLKKVDKKL